MTFEAEKYSDFSDKVAVVTGAAQGIGKSIADALQQAGAIVARLDIQFVDDHKTQSYHIDISNSKDVKLTIEKIENELGPIDFLINAAGILYMGSFLDSPEEHWHKTFAVNTTGAFNVYRNVAQRMITRKRGVIIGVGSNASSVPRVGMSSYASSKAATTHMLKCLGLELAEFNIRCNIVAPGSTDTPMQHQLWNDSTGSQKVIDGSLESYRLGIPLKRIATPQQISNVVMFLLSENASHITLETIVVDGGATLGC